MVQPRGQYAPRAYDGILVLQRGENASCDYYLRPRLGRLEVPLVLADLDSDPSACGLLNQAQALFVVICRYASPAWLDALQRGAGRLARVAFFLDDDLPGMMRDPSLPQSVRGKVALHFGAHVDRIGALAGEVWASTPVLAERYPQAMARVLAPLPEAEPPPAAGRNARLVVYHGTDVHAAERRFVIAVARRLHSLGADARIELVGDAGLARACADLPNLDVVPQTPWPQYRTQQAGRRAAICLAPLTPSAVNEARAPVKVFDAARLGAAGLYADARPYRGFVNDGVDGLLAPMDPELWAGRIRELLAEPDRRMSLAEAARSRLAALGREGLDLPPPPGA